MNVGIDEAWSDPHAGAIVKVVDIVIGNVRAYGDDLVILDQHAADEVHVLGRVEDATIFEKGSHTATFLPVFGLGAGTWVSDFFLVSGSSPNAQLMAAMRTKMPFSTCEVIMECSESAVRSSSSTPRLMGPGWRTRQSGAALRRVFRLIWYSLVNSCTELARPFSIRSLCRRR